MPTHEHRPIQPLESHEGLDVPVEWCRECGAVRVGHGRYPDYVWGSWELPLASGRCTLNGATALAREILDSNTADIRADERHRIAAALVERALELLRGRDPVTSSQDDVVKSEAFISAANMVRCNKIADDGKRS